MKWSCPGRQKTGRRDRVYVFKCRNRVMMRRKSSGCWKPPERRLQQLFQAIMNPSMTSARTYASGKVIRMGRSRRSGALIPMRSLRQRESLRMRMPRRKGQLWKRRQSLAVRAGRNSIPFIFVFIHQITVRRNSLRVMWNSLCRRKPRVTGRKHSFCRRRQREKQFYGMSAGSGHRRSCSCLAF